jgi:hypothetical protein
MDSKVNHQPKEIVYGPGMTLTDITDFLLNEDKTFQKKIILSDSAF